MKLRLLLAIFLVVSTNSYAECQNIHKLMDRGFSKNEINNYLKKCQGNKLISPNTIKLKNSLNNISKGNFRFYDFNFFLKIAESPVRAAPSYINFNGHKKSLENLEKYKLITIKNKNNIYILDKTLYGKKIYGYIINELNNSKKLIQSSSVFPNIKSSLNGLNGNEISYFINTGKTSTLDYDKKHRNIEIKLINNKLRKSTIDKYGRVEYSRTSLGSEVYKQLVKTLKNRLMLK